MNISKKVLLSTLVLSIILSVLFTGCEEVTNNDNDDSKIYIKELNDDGMIAQEENLVEGIILSEDNKPIQVGLFTSSDYSSSELNYLSRGILRFDISDWEKTDITFNIKCINVQGNPEGLEVYLMDDPGQLTNYNQLQDVSSIWLLTESSARFIGEFYPSKNEWLKVNIQKDMVESIINEKYSKGEYFTILLKLFFDFTLDEYGNYFEFASSNYSPDDKSDRPYIEYK